jgi:putative NADH-flavin reductase
MKIAIIGSTGFVGLQLVAEALQRGHQVTGIARGAATTTDANLTAVQVDVTDTAALATALKGSDVVFSAYNAGWTNPELYNDFIKGSKAIQAAVKQAGVKRLVVVGGAGSLYIAPDIQLVDSAEFPAEYKAGATAARDYFNILKEDQDLDWTFFSPAIEMHPGITTGRTGHYRTALDNPVFDADNRSRLSVQDLAVALIDEAEEAKHIRQRFTAAY